MKKSFIKSKKRKNQFKFRKTEIQKPKYLKINHKIILLIILLILYITFFFFKNQIGYDENNWNNNINNNIKRIEINGKEEIIDVANLPQSEHYKILYPRVIHHNFKKVTKEDLFKLEDSYDYKKMKETGKDKYIYHTCAVAKGKYENLYAREFVEYYLSIGVEKFYIGDDTEENFENLGDVLHDYIKKGIVDVEFIHHLNTTHHGFFELAFKPIKFRCKWFIFFDFDEFLIFHDKNMNIKTYLDMPMFDKCESIKIHWIVFDDNNLLYYDKRPMIERFTHSLPHHESNVYHKSILRGKDYNAVVFPSDNHQPNLDFQQCDAEGNIEKLGQGIMGPKKYKYCYIAHYSFKTAEEFGFKLLRGYQQNIKYNFENKINDFASLNELTEEKLKIIENVVKQTFPKFHKNNN